MAAGALSIKLRCASWQQLATIYRRDLSRGTMFLKASTPPDIGTSVRIDLALPSETVIVLSGVVDKHVTDPTRGSGVELKLGAIPETTVWMIESALAAEAKVRGTQPLPPTAGAAPMRAVTPAGGIPIMPPSMRGDSDVSSRSTGPVQSLSDGEDLAKAEMELHQALASEVESLKKLNPFLVLGVGYEAADADVRAAFGELTKRYHPDRFARYQSNELRQIAAEIFILIRDAYRKIGDDGGRAQVLQSLGRSPAPRAVPMPRQATMAISPPPIPRRQAPPPPSADPHTAPTTNPSMPIAPPPMHTAQIPVAQPRATTAADGSGAMKPAAPDGQPKHAPAVTTPMPHGGELAAPKGLPIRPTPPNLARDPSKPLPKIETERRPILSASPPVLDGGVDLAALEELLDSGRHDEALAGFKVLAKKHPADRTFRAGIELVEGLKSLKDRDRLEAAQRFEAALEIDPSNERAARELAEMRRQATNERKGLLSRLMNKKE